MAGMISRPVHVAVLKRAHRQRLHPPILVVLVKVHAVVRPVVHVRIGHLRVHDVWGLPLVRAKRAEFGHLHVTRDRRHFAGAEGNDDDLVDDVFFASTTARNRLALLGCSGGSNPFYCLVALDINPHQEYKTRRQRSGSGRPRGCCD